jgi:hypothetical protein
MSSHHSLLDYVKNVGERHGLTMLPPLPKPFRAAQIEEGGATEGWVSEDSIETGKQDRGNGTPACFPDDHC